MALNVFELFGKIVVDNSGAEKGIDKTVRHAQDAESKLAKTFKKVGTMVAAAFSVKAVVDFGKQCTEAYASIAAEESAFAQIMGDYADTAQAKLNAVSDATGVSATRMTGAMTSLTAKFKGLGYDVEDATTLASDGLLIASDAAAFWDMSLDESMSHLNSFINGSYEGGEAIGLFANDTQMAAFAIEQGIVKDTKAWAALDEAQRQATRLLYAKNMMEASGATGQAAKEADQYANVMANLKEHWRQFQGIIGKPILEKLVLPAMQKLNEFMPKLNEAVQSGIEWLDEGFGKIKGYFEDVFTEDGINMDALPKALKNMFGDLGRSVGSLLSSFGRTLKNGWSNTVWPMIQKTFKATFGIDVPEWSKIESTIVEWWDGGNGIASAIASVCNWTLNLFGAPAEVTAEDVSAVLSTWWSNTKTFVQNACAWVLKLFSNPKETAAEVGEAISTWWSGVVGSVQNACAWVLNVFQNPPSITAQEVETILSTWWSNTKKFVQAACSWVLNLFGAPDGVTADGVKSVLSTWWSNAKKFVQGACEWTLNLFTKPTEDQEAIISVISGWWAAVCAVVEGACNWALHMFGAPEAVTVESVKSVLSTWWSNTKKFVQDACSWVLSIFKAPDEEQTKAAAETLKAWFNSVLEVAGDVFNITVGIVGGSITAARNKITSWFESVKEGLGLSATATVTAVYNTAAQSGGGPGIGKSGFLYKGEDDSRYIPGFSTGLDYVPYDNYLARLHKGEAVLTSGEADAWRGGYNSSGVETTLAQIAALLRDVVRNTGADKSVVLDTGVLAGALAPKMNQQLGMMGRLRG